MKKIINNIMYPMLTGLLYFGILHGISSHMSMNNKSIKYQNKYTINRFFHNNHNFQKLEKNLQKLKDNNYHNKNYHQDNDSYESSIKINELSDKSLFDSLEDSLSKNIEDIVKDYEIGYGDDNSSIGKIVNGHKVREKVNDYATENRVIKKKTISKKKNQKKSSRYYREEPRYTDINSPVIPIILYHNMKKNDGHGLNAIYNVTPDNFKRHLEWLWEHGYQTMRLRDFLNNDYSEIIPGKKPLLIEFDDGFKSQFRVYKIKGKNKDEKIIVDKNSAVGILVEFGKKHPDFGNHADFFVNFYNTPFGQKRFLKFKFKYLKDHGMDVWNHTVNHKRLDKLSKSKADYEIAEGYRRLDSIYMSIDSTYNPDSAMRVLAYPYSMPPKSYFKGITYKSKFYWTDAALVARGHHFSLMADNPQFNRLKIIRKQVDDYTLRKVMKTDAHRHYRKPNYITRR